MSTFICGHVSGCGFDVGSLSAKSSRVQICSHPAMSDLSEEDIPSFASPAVARTIRRIASKPSEAEDPAPAHAGASDVIGAASASAAIDAAAKAQEEESRVQGQKRNAASASEPLVVKEVPTPEQEAIVRRIEARAQRAAKRTAKAAAKAKEDASRVQGLKHKGKSPKGKSKRQEVKGEGKGESHQEEGSRVQDLNHKHKGECHQRSSKGKGLSLIHI